MLQSVLAALYLYLRVSVSALTGFIALTLVCEAAQWAAAAVRLVAVSRWSCWMARLTARLEKQGSRRARSLDEPCPAPHPPPVSKGGQEWGLRSQSRGNEEEDCFFLGVMFHTTLQIKYARLEQNSQSIPFNNKNNIQCFSSIMFRASILRNPVKVKKLNKKLVFPPH